MWERVKGKDNLNPFSQYNIARADDFESIEVSKNMEIFHYCKFNYRIELKILLKKEKLFILSNISFQRLSAADTVALI